MRFREHFGIAKDVAGEKAGFFYLTGSLFPDYVERHRIHRSDETLGLIKKRIEIKGTVYAFDCFWCNRVLRSDHTDAAVGSGFHSG